MAYLEEDEKLQQQQDQQTPGQSTAGETTQVAPLVGGSSNNVTSAPGAGGGGQTGTGGWVNIQSYMDANKGNTGSAEMLNQKVGGQFANEKNQMTTQAEGLKTQAEKVAQGVNDAKANVGTWLDDAAKSYSFKGQHRNGYDDNVSKIKNVLEGQYTGPKNFAYGISDQTNTYGSNLGNSDAFNQMMGDMYQERAGKPLTAGGRALQTQLDVNNDALNASRDNLLKEYAGLGDLREQTVKDTDAALANAEKLYRTNQNNFRDYLGKTSNDLDSAIDKLESDARYGYETTLGKKSGYGVVGWDRINEWINDGGPQGAVGHSAKEDRQGRGIWDDNLTWSQLEKERKAYEDKNFGGEMAKDWDRNYAALNDFYKEQDSKYKKTADAEERKWNTLQEILNTGKKAKKYGFNVRG